MRLIKTLDDFINYVETWRLERDNRLLRSILLGLIMENTEKWSLALKALLIKNPNDYISVSYLQEKLDFMKENPLKPHLFLDFEGVLIYTVLINRVAKNNQKEFINHIDSYKELTPK